MNQYALGYKLLQNSWKVKANTIRTAFLFGLEHEMQVDVFKLEKNDGYGVATGARNYQEAQKELLAERST